MGADARNPDEPLVTKTGKVLTDAEIAELSAEAERGYCVVRIGTASEVPGDSPRRARRGGAILCGRPLPCSTHPEK